jgi:glycosyltransferase involved in cell wall biosynthesis
MNILIVSGLVPWAPGVGGGYVIGFKLAEAIAKRGHNVTYVATAPENLQREIDWGKALYIPPSKNPYISPFLKFWKTKNLIDKHDIIYVQWYEGFPYGIHRRIFRKSKFVLGVYGPEFHKFPWSLKSPLSLYEFFAAKSADLVFSLSEFSKRNISQAYLIPLSRIKVIYGGVDETFLLNRGNKKERGIFSLLFCGRLAGRKKQNQKGLDILLKAMPHILKEHDVVLNIIGDGPLLEYYKRLSKELAIDKHVRFLGFIEYSKMPEYYSASDLFVFPSRRESFGLVLAEAMASGLPVVSTNVTAIPEVIKDGETGILVPPNDPEKFAKAVNSLLNDPQRMREMGIKGRERVKEYFTWDKVAERAIRYFEEIL